MHIIIPSRNIFLFHTLRTTLPDLVDLAPWRWKPGSCLQMLVNVRQTTRHHIQMAMISVIIS